LVPNPTTAPAPTTTVAAHQGPDSAQAGDCIWNKHQPNSTADDDHPEVEVVSCDDPHAQARVLGRVTTDTGAAACDTAYPDADAYYTSTHTGTSYGTFLDYTLCLRTLK
jgi:hypothetical protein